MLLGSLIFCGAGEGAGRKCCERGWGLAPTAAFLPTQPGAAGATTQAPADSAEMHCGAAGQLRGAHAALAGFGSPRAPAEVAQGHVLRGWLGIVRALAWEAQTGIEGAQLVMSRRQARHRQRRRHCNRRQALPARPSSS